MKLEWQDGGPFPYIGIWENDCIRFEAWCQINDEDPEIVAVIKRRRNSGDGHIYFALYAYKVIRGGERVVSKLLSTPAFYGSMRGVKRNASAFFGGVKPEDLLTLEEVMNTE